MPQAPQLAPDLAQGLLRLARSLVAASRHWSLYPADHPSVAQSLERLRLAIGDVTGKSVLSIAATPETLIIEGARADARQAPIAEAAALLHARDILELRFVGEVPAAALQSLLTLLAMDAQERRDRGGPAHIWKAIGHSSIALRQIDYRSVLERSGGARESTSQRDDVWQSIVRSIADGSSGVFDERAQERLIAIAGSSADIGHLASALMAPKCSADGSPMITSQAATVLAAFRHLTSIVTAAAPERVADVMGNLATAASSLDPHVVLQLLNTTEDPHDRLGVIRGVSAAFDDVKVAQLLATALAIDGQASDRLATVFNTIAPDEDRRRRVLTLTRELLSETDFGRASQFEQLWTSMEALLVSYNDKQFVSEAYRSSLDGAGARAERMAAADLPPELPVWLDTLGEQSVRALSVALLIDLLNLETDAARAVEIAKDLAALADDLLMAGAYEDVLAVTRILADRGDRADASGRDACRRALNELGESMAMRETVALLGDLDEPSWRTLRDAMEHVGPSVVEALKPIAAVEQETTSSHRAGDVIVGFGSAAAARLVSLTDDRRWFVQRTAARLLGRIGAADSVAALQGLLRRGDPRVVRDAVSALAGIPDPSAARAIHTVLRAATGDLRRAVVEALVADRDPRVVPMLARILKESDVTGKDHSVVLETLGALRAVHTDEAVPAIVTVITQRRWFRRQKLMAVATAGVATLDAMGTATATAALDEAETRGSRMLRRVVRDGRTRR